MAKIKEIAGVIGETLRLPPSVVDSHVRGLRAAERITNEADDVGAADLLCACLSTDAGNATGPFHLPFIGAYRIAGGSAEFITAGLPEFELLSATAPTFGEGIAHLIRSVSDGSLPIDVVNFITLAGSGPRLRATIGLQDGGDVHVVFGNQPLFEHMRLMAMRPGYVERSVDIGGQVIVGLADLLSGLPYSPPLLDACSDNMRVN